MKKIIIIMIINFFILLIFLLFVFQPLESIKDVNSSPEIVILNQEDEPILHLVNNHKITPIELPKLSKQNQAILLTIEDKSFYQHSGFNLSRMMKTLLSNVRNKTSYGASTITQQYIKNVYLSNKKTMSRKLKELYYAIKLEQIATKDEILTNYLNCIYLGNDIYGIANGAKYYFNKSYEDLTIQEMTTFVALLNAPTYYSTHLDQLELKKNKLLAVLKQNQIITQNEYDEALKPISFHYQKEIYPSNLLYFVDEVLKEYQSLSIHPKFNETITIHTKYHDKLNNNSFSTTANYAYMVMDKSGFILSIAGNKNYYESSYNIATNGHRDIGSTIKPILYYEALKCGFDPNTTFYSAPYTFSYQKEKVTIKNNASIYPYQEINMYQALATSDNIYAIKMHQRLGFKTLANYFKAYNIEANPLPSLALGSIGMSLSELTQLYSQFFTEGTYLKSRYIESVMVGDKKLYQANIKNKTIGIPDYYQQIKSLMTGLFNPSIPHATAGSIGPYLKTKCYGKSGLTDYDSYMMGFNEDILIGVWSGYLDNTKLTNSHHKRLPKEIFLKLMNSYQ